MAGTLGFVILVLPMHIERTHSGGGGGGGGGEYGSGTSLLVVRESSPEMTREFADESVRKRGHVCDEACTPWKNL